MEYPLFVIDVDDASHFTFERAAYKRMTSTGNKQAPARQNWLRRPSLIN
jgi:hypothetical protein